ncbi:unnamed protein product [Acanthoscelides obtectus]|uniref:Uncharacterized protein n=1 Tax=Acanthoscelides obtectus TaxID=200917 RepID=A0A9P0LAL4_ACAOB|nr:unnamed protein product [Acanthoscelides obtectus]CAK1671101.1 hypothetical protein AOBTE_LOCUS28057 [Acanthoscelides obtectus]
MTFTMIACTSSVPSSGSLFECFFVEYVLPPNGSSDKQNSEVI